MQPRIRERREQFLEVQRALSISANPERLLDATVRWTVARLVQEEKGWSTMSSIATYAAAPSQSRSTTRGRFALIGLATVVAAVLANVLFYYVGQLFVTYNPDFVVLANLGGTITMTAASAIIAVLVYAAVLRFSKNPVRVYTIISAVVLVVSVIPDYTMIPSEPGASTGQAVILALMHVVAAAVIVPMLTILARPNAR